MSSVLDWLSLILAHGESELSSPSMLAKLLRRWWLLLEVPKMLRPCPKDAELDVLCRLNGVLGLPNWGCCSRPKLKPRRFIDGDPVGGGKEARLDGDHRFVGVPGMT
jgi:hypothetical protein